MPLETQLARHLVASHPIRAAAVLDRYPVAETTRLLQRIPAAEAARTLARMAPIGAAEVLELLPEARAATILKELGRDAASRLCRRLSEERREALLARLTDRAARALRTLLHFPETSAGALMDPDTLALSAEMTVRDALSRIRESPETTQYNVYVVDRAQVLVGVLNLRELLRAKPRARLEEVMVRNPARFEALTHQRVLIGHPLWREVRAMPIVDEQGCYLGAIRYNAIRPLEQKLLDGLGADGSTAEALGDLFSTAATGVLDALTRAQKPGNP